MGPCFESTEYGIDPVSSTSANDASMGPCFESTEYADGSISARCRWKASMGPCFESTEYAISRTCRMTRRWLQWGRALKARNTPASAVGYEYQASFNGAVL